MAKPLSDGTAYVAIDAVDRSNKAISWKLSHEADTFDTTCGFGTEYRSMAGGLKQTKLEVVLCYEQGTTPPGAMAGELYELTLGVEGTVVGTGKHVQEFILEGVDPIERKVEGGQMAMTYSYTGAEPPTTNLFDGGVWT